MATPTLRSTTDSAPIAGRKYRIYSMAVRESVLTDHGEIAAAVFKHFDVLLGTDPS
jgi:hypothetical protein